VANSSDLIAVLDVQARVIYANPVVERMLGYVPETQAGRSMFDLVHPDDLDATVAIFIAGTQNPGSNRPAVFRFQTASGEWCFLEAISTNCLDDPAIGGIVVNARDVTEQTRLARALRILSHGNQTLVRATSEASLLADTCQSIVDSGGYLLAWVGYLECDAAQTVRSVASAGRTGYLDDLRVTCAGDECAGGPTGEAIRMGTEQVLDDIATSGEFGPWQAAAQLYGLRASCVMPLAVDGDIIGALNIYSGEVGAFNRAEVTLLRELADDLTYGIGRLRDTERIARNELLLREAERLAHVGHWEWDLATDRFEFLADEMFAIYGVMPGEWAGTIEGFLAFVAPEARPTVKEALDQAHKGGGIGVERKIVRPDGEVRFVRECTEVVAGSDGQPTRVVGASIDITGEKLAEQRLEHSEQFLSAITDNMAEGMIATDSDGTVTFVNSAAERLLGWNAGDLIGRPGHATFHYLRLDGSPYPGEECELQNVFAHGRKLHVAHDSFVRRDGTSIPVAYSASPLRTDSVRGAVIVFDDITDTEAEQLRVERQLEKLSWVGRIRDALDQHRFVLYAQPIVDLQTRAVVQNELLIRMVTAEGEIVLPQRFLPTAEEFGLISEIDRWVIGETARLAAEGHRVEFNLSAKSVMDPNVLTIVRNAFEVAGASPELVVCEITETALVRDTATAEAFVRGLNDFGCKVALDDFGSGYSGFGILKRLPVSFLKIDREFVGDLLVEASSRHVVSAVVNLAKAFSMQTVAEGAEDTATLELLAELGVDYVQGYVIARPAPVAEALSRPG
jgi:PAS domain S-box-containing protein